jgi:cobyrinic acid a,c-diamide synthase
MDVPRVVIAGVKGGSGKTTVTLALVRALRTLKGLRVVPFKKGPDYIDAGWLAAAAEQPCYNLDPFLIGRERVLESFSAHFSGDVAVIEGNRGLYDGLDSDGSYSTAALAVLLDSPVVLVVDCTKMTRTSAAVVMGCMALDRNVMVRGVVLNQVAGSRHEAVVRESVEKYCRVPVVGAIPRFGDGRFPERHMGLTPHQEHPDTSSALAFAEELGGKYLDVDAILRIARGARPIGEGALNRPCGALRGARTGRTTRIGIIRDAAFQFYYPENVEELRRFGAETVEVSALDGRGLPSIDGLYIGGGFPETNALSLARNKGFRNQVRSAAEAGMPIYAECGGLMFLGRFIQVGTKRFPMAGVLPLGFQMKARPQAHGYTTVEVDRPNPFYPVGTVLNGHEFHYSAVVEGAGRDGQSSDTVFAMVRGKGLAAGRDGLVHGNVLATYTHVHALGVPEWARGIIGRAVEYSEKNR